MRYIRFGNPSLVLLCVSLFTLVLTQPSEAVNSVSNVQMVASSPAALEYGMNVNITFDYSTDDAGGARIFMRPFSNGSLTPNYAASGSSLYPTGNGSGSAFFTITSGLANVDHIRVQILNSDQSTLLSETFLPVTYHFGPSGTITNIHLIPSSPATLTLGDQVDIGFDYSTPVAGGVRIFFRPFTGGSLTPNYGAGGSPLFGTGSGSGTTFFTITTAGAVVDAIRVQVFNDSQSTMYLEFLFPVDYTFQAPAPVKPTTWGQIKSRTWNQTP